MNNPALYTRVNGIQRSEANQLLKEFCGVFNWRSDGKDSLMDIGCGSGDIVFDYILPMLPENFERLIGADLSEKMLLHAQQQYPHPKIFFERFDLGVDARIQSLKYVQPVDHITSFYCLHWVPNQKQAMQNIYNLLKPNGDCLLVFGTYAVLYEAYEEMAETSKWGKYMSDVNRFISPYQHSHDPEKEFGQLLNDCHFSRYRLELRKKNFAFDSKEAIKSKFAHFEFNFRGNSLFESFCFCRFSDCFESIL